jgi:glycosyltransferase involved in cell wall biosynthesis
MNVWIVNHYADAPDRPSGTRHFDLARRLVSRGHSVTIFASGFNHVTGREERLSGRRLYRSQTFEGVHFVWLKTFAYRGNTWRRQVNMLSYLVVFLLVQTRFERPAAVVGSTVHPFAALGGWLAARARGARFVFEIRDLWPQTLVDLGALREGSVVERLLRAIEAFLVRRASLVLALQPGVRDYLAARGLPTAHFAYLPNGVDLAAFDAQARPSGREPDRVEVVRAIETVRAMRRDGRFVLGYVGALGRVNDVGVIVRAANLAELRAPGRIGLVVIGDGPERPTVEREASDRSAVFIGQPVPKRFVPELLVELDATVVHATETPIYRYGISFNKLFEYMAAARPVVFACTSAYDPVAGTGAGIYLRPDDPEALAEAFLELAGLDQAQRAAMGAAGRTYVEANHNIERLGDRLAELLVTYAGPAGDRTESRS